MNGERGEVDRKPSRQGGVRMRGRENLIVLGLAVYTQFHMVHVIVTIKIQVNLNIRITKQYSACMIGRVSEPCLQASISKTRPQKPILNLNTVGGSDKVELMDSATSIDLLLFLSFELVFPSVFAVVSRLVAYIV